MPKTPDATKSRKGRSAEEPRSIAQALVLCGLPFAKVPDTQSERSARLADGSYLTVTFATSNARWVDA